MPHLRRIIRVLFCILTILLVFISALGAFAARWALSTWANLQMDELIFTLSTLTGTGGDMVVKFIRSCVVPAAVVALLAAAIAVAFAVKKPARLRRLLVICAVLSVSTLAASVGVFWQSLDISEYIEAATTSSDYIADNYVDPSEIDLSFPEKKRNLIYIFLESTEITFADTESGGAFSENVIPELTEIAMEGDDFSGSDPSLNGADVPVSCSWTMAGMFAQTSGLPLKIGVDSNDMIYQDSFFSGITTLGDILESEGYNQALLIGSDAAFGGRKLYFTEHGGYKIYDYQYAVDNNYIPQDHYVWWGYEDLYLFENAKLELAELSAQDEPFNLTILTVDTHFEDGYVCSRCGDASADQYSNVYSCSSCQVSEFIKWVQQQPFYENTTIVLAGDHLTMDSDYCIDVSDDYDRRTYTAVINSAASPASSECRTYTTLDLFPTTLAAMGVDIPGDRLGLGTNLYSSTPTLAERDGMDTINTEFEKNSPFMKELANLKTYNPYASAETYYLNETGQLRLRIYDIHNVPETIITLYAEICRNDTDVCTCDMELQSDGSYVGYADISFLPDRYGYVNVYAVCESGSVYNLKYFYGDLAISSCPDLDEYLAELNGLDHHTIIIAVRDEASNRLTPSNRAALHALGLEYVDLDSGLGYRDSYYAVISPYGIVEELSSDSALEYDGLLPGGKSLYVHSAGYDYGNTCSIIIGGVEYAANKRGLNFVIYDNDAHRVVDQSLFDTHSGVRTLSSAQDFRLSSADALVEYLPETDSLLINVSNIAETENDVSSVNAEIWSGTQEKQFFPLEQAEDGTWFAVIDPSLLPSGELQININAVDAGSIQYRLYYISGTRADLAHPADE